VVIDLIVVFQMIALLHADGFLLACVARSMDFDGLVWYLLYLLHADGFLFTCCGAFDGFF
jgi:hypothetical protein